MKIQAFYFVMLAVPVASLAQTDTLQTLVGLSAESSQLSNGSPGWHSETLRVARKSNPRDVRELGFTQTRRFGLNDKQIGGLYVTPLSGQATLSLSGRISPSHRVLARHELESTLQYEFAPAWLVHAGLGNRRYSTANINSASLALEHYFSSFSLSAAWRPVRALGANASSTELRGAYYYGNASLISLIASSGQEASTLNPNTVLLVDVRSTALLGRHSLSRQWAFSYALSRTWQGGFYRQDTVHLGAEYIF